LAITAPELLRPPPMTVGLTGGRTKSTTQTVVLVSASASSNNDWMDAVGAALLKGSGQVSLVGLAGDGVRAYQRLYPFLVHQVARDPGEEGGGAVRADCFGSGLPSAIASSTVPPPTIASTRCTAPSFARAGTKHRPTPPPPPPTYPPSTHGVELNDNGSGPQLYLGNLRHVRCLDWNRSCSSPCIGSHDSWFEAQYTCDPLTCLAGVASSDRDYYPLASCYNTEGSE
jgi:hypothetical protein